MATSPEFITYVCDQIVTPYPVRFKKMFGEYMVYIHEKPILLVCDNTIYVKKLEVLDDILKDAEVGIPYTGAKEHYIITAEEKEIFNTVIALLEPVIPVPKQKIKK